MHGVLIREKKVLSETELEAERMAGESASNLLSTAMRNKQNNSFAKESFNMTTELIKLNPELGFAWNFRRLCLETFSNEEFVNELKVLNSIMIELQMTKSYCLWNHRKWILKKLIDFDLACEEKFILTILRLDSRNFHCWAYRQFLETELGMKFDLAQLSLQLIESDFSCYSAWHIRKRVDIVDIHSEQTLIWNALFTEPNDQSVWQYHDWFVSKHWDELREKDEEFLNELEAIVEEKDMKYLLLWKQKTEPNNSNVILLKKIDPMRIGYYNSLIDYP